MLMFAKTPVFNLLSCMDVAISPNLLLGGEKNNRAIICNVIEVHSFSLIRSTSLAEAECS